MHHCYCHNQQHSYDMEQPPSSPLHDPQHPPPHKFDGCRGIWIYHCFCHCHVSGDHSQIQKTEKYLDNKPTFRLYCQAKTDYSLTVREGKVILAHTNPSDPYQHWYKDEKFGANVKDEEGFSSFALVNKATGQALKHAAGVKYPVRLTEYNPNELDKSVLWSMSKNQGGGYRHVRAVDNIHLNADARDTDSYDTSIVFWEWLNSDSQK